MISEDKRAELLLSHYNDTFQHLLYYWKLRNRLFVYILVLLALMSLDTASPGILGQWVNAYIAKTLESKGQTAAALNFAVIGSLAWFTLLCLVINYYQRSIHVDRQYRYLDHVEKQFCGLMGDDCITREGKSYSSTKGVYKPGETGQRPLYLRWVGPLYTYFFPIFIILFTIYRLRVDVLPHSVASGFNVFVGIVLIGYNLVYLWWVKFRA